MATTYNFTDGSITNQIRMTQRTPIENGPFFLRHVIDFALQNIEAGASDVAQALIIPAGITVMDAGARIITAETADSTFDLGYGTDANYWGTSLNADVAGEVQKTLTGSVTWDPATNIADGDEEAKDITVTGAAVGEKVTVAHSTDILDLVLSASVGAEDTVTAVLANNTGGNIDVTSGTTTAWVHKGNRSGQPLYFSAADTIDITASTVNGDVDFDALKIEVWAMCRKVLAY